MVNSKSIKGNFSGLGLKDYKDTTFFQGIIQKSKITILRLKEVMFENLSSKIFTNVH
jgi:hypothetical protein